MRILIDGLPLLGEASIATYLRELLRHMRAADASHDYELFMRCFRVHTKRKAERLLADPDMAGFKPRITRVPDCVMEWCWTRGAFHVPCTEIWLGRPDVFLSTIYVTPVVRRTAVIMIAYDVIPLRFPQFYNDDQPLLTARLRRGIERAGAIIAISECTKRDFVHLLGADPAKIHVVYPGVDARFGPIADRDQVRLVRKRYGLKEPYLLYVGSLGPHKNVETLVRVFRRLKTAGRIPHQLVLCGRAQWGPEVVKASQDLIRAGDCVILDLVPAADVPHLYHGAEAFVFLSLYEGFGLPPLEAMACGVPVVASNAGSLPEVVGEAALQVPPTDEDAVEQALSAVLTKADLRDAMRVRGLKQAAQFSWPAAARRTLDILTEVAPRS